MVERQSGLTYQLGSETMQSPSEDAQIALAELKEATFSVYCCGPDFVVGQGKLLDETLKFTP
jgi:hypothetical protein